MIHELLPRTAKHNSSPLRLNQWPLHHTYVACLLMQWWGMSCQRSSSSVSRRWWRRRCIETLSSSSVGCAAVTSQTDTWHANIDITLIISLLILVILQSILPPLPPSSLSRALLVHHFIWPFHTTSLVLATVML